MIPAPSGNENAPLKALIFDSYYDPYKGVIVYFRVVSGKIKAGDTIKMDYDSENDKISTTIIHPDNATK